MGLGLQPPHQAGNVGRVNSASRQYRSVFVTAVVALGGCGWQSPQSTLAPRSDFARAISGVYGLIAWATVIIALVVFALLALVLIRYREQRGAPLPRQTRGHTLLEIGWTIAPALVLLVIAIPTIEVIFRTQQAAPRDAIRVVVRGWQWWWEFRYPDLGVVTANELYLPVGRPVVLSLEGPDVIHSFWVPQLGGKRDVVPGRHNTIVLTPQAAGEYPGQCAEFCGASHANMRLRVFAVAPEQFDRWLVAQRAAAVEAAGDAAAGKEIFTRNACVGCHTIRGVSAGILAPDLTHFGSRTTLAAGMFPNTLDNVTAWLRDPPAIKPGSKMPNLGLSEADARALAVYLLSLK